MSEWKKVVKTVKTAPVTETLVMLVTLIFTVVFDLAVAIAVGMLLVGAFAVISRIKAIKN